MLYSNWAASFSKNTLLQSLMSSILQKGRLSNVWSEQTVLHSKLPTLHDTKRRVFGRTHPCVVPVCLCVDAPADADWVREWVGKDPVGRMRWIVRHKVRTGQFGVVCFRERVVVEGRESVGKRFEKVLEEYRERKEEGMSIEIKIQPYIDRPLLVRDRKFDFQLTLLICRNFDTVVVYLWTEPLFRICAGEYYKPSTAADFTHSETSNSVSQSPSSKRSGFAPQAINFSDDSQFTDHLPSTSKSSLTADELNQALLTYETMLEEHEQLHRVYTDLLHQQQQQQAQKSSKSKQTAQAFASFE